MVSARQASGGRRWASMQACTCGRLDEGRAVLPGRWWPGAPGQKARCARRVAWDCVPSASAAHVAMPQTAAGSCGAARRAITPNSPTMSPPCRCINVAGVGGPTGGMIQNDRLKAPIRLGAAVCLKVQHTDIKQRRQRYTAPSFGLALRKEPRPADSGTWAGSCCASARAPAAFNQ